MGAGRALPEAMRACPTRAEKSPEEGGGPQGTRLYFTFGAALMRTLSMSMSISII